MRKNMMTVVVSALAFGVGSATFVLAEGRAVSKKGSAVSFRMASTTPAEGFQEMKADDGQTYYVSPRVTFTHDEVVSAMHGQVRGDLDISLTPEAMERMDRTNGELIAVLVNGKLTTTGRIGNVGRDSVSVSGLADRDLTRFATLVGAGSASGPVIRLVPQTPSAKVGDVVTVDAYLMGARGVRTFQVAVDAVGGRTGSLTREAGKIDESRSDYLFGSSRAITAVDDSRGRMGGTLFDGIVDASQASYLGSFNFRVSDDASGSFVFKVRYDEESFVLDGKGEHMSFAPVNATIKVGAGSARSNR